MAFIDCLFRPYEPTYLLFGINPGIVTWVPYLIACCWYGLFTVGLTSAFGMVLSLGLVYFAHALPLLRNDLRMGQVTYRITSALRDHTLALINTWRAMEIFINIINVEVLFCLRYIDGCLKTGVVICLLTTAFHGDSVGLGTKVLLISGSIMTVIIWIVMFTLGGVHNRWSQETLESWKQVYWPNKREWKFNERTKHSCKPFTFGNVHQYYMTPMTLAVFLDSISANTITALITYRDILRTSRKFY